MFGTGDLNQSFCRLSAVYGAVFVLGSHVTEMKLDLNDGNKIVSVNAGSTKDLNCKFVVSNFDHLPDGFYTIQLTEDSQEKSLVRLYTNPDTGLRGFGYGVWDGGAHLPLFDITDSCIIKPVNLDL